VIGHAKQHAMTVNIARCTKESGWIESVQLPERAATTVVTVLCDAFMLNDVSVHRKSPSGTLYVVA
jgi:hypothetical protein